MRHKIESSRFLSSGHGDFGRHRKSPKMPLPFDVVILQNIHELIRAAARVAKGEFLLFFVALMEVCRESGRLRLVIEKLLPVSEQIASGAHCEASARQVGEAGSLCREYVREQAPMRGLRPQDFHLGWMHDHHFNSCFNSITDTRQTYRMLQLTSCKFQIEGPRELELAPTCEDGRWAVELEGGRKVVFTGLQAQPGSTAPTAVMQLGSRQYKQALSMVFNRAGDTPSLECHTVELRDACPSCGSEPEPVVHQDIPIEVRPGTPASEEALSKFTGWVEQTVKEDPWIAGPWGRGYEHREKFSPPDGFEDSDPPRRGHERTGAEGSFRGRSSRRLWHLIQVSRQVPEQIDRLQALLDEEQSDIPNQDSSGPAHDADERTRRLLRELVKTHRQAQEQIDELQTLLSSEEQSDTTSHETYYTTQKVD